MIPKEALNANYSFQFYGTIKNKIASTSEKVCAFIEKIHLLGILSLNCAMPWVSGLT